MQRVKQGLKKLNHGLLETKLARWLFKYCIVPHSVTERAPAELLMSYHLRSALELLYPDIGRKVRVQQEQQKERHDHHVRPRACVSGSNVYISSFGQGKRWLGGTTLQALETEAEVELGDGWVVCRHLEHVRPHAGPNTGGQSDLGQTSMPVGATTDLTAPEAVSDTGDPDDSVETQATPARYPWRDCHSPGYLKDYVHSSW